MTEVYDANTETKLVAETMVSAAIVQMAVNLAMQLALMDGGSFTTVRAVMAACDEKLRPPAFPPVIPVDGRHVEKKLAIRIADAKLSDLVNVVTERAATGLIRNGIKVRR